MLTKDQLRAAHAYQCLRQIQDQGQDVQKEYKIAVNNLAAVVKRSGLAAGLAFLERPDRSVNQKFCEHLAKAKIPGLEIDPDLSLVQQASRLELAPYMLATREMLKTLIWFRRAVQAIQTDDDPQPGG